jgi:hypothetical protein
MALFGRVSRIRGAVTIAIITEFGIFTEKGVNRSAVGIPRERCPRIGPRRAQPDSRAGTPSPIREPLATRLPGCEPLTRAAGDPANGVLFGMSYRKYSSSSSNIRLMWPFGCILVIRSKMQCAESPAGNRNAVLRPSPVGGLA